MAFENATATDFLDLLARVEDFATRTRFVHDLAFTGTGPGTFSDGPAAADNATVETWTLTVTDDSTPGSEVWSVTGSVSGAAASATTGVAYDNGSISFTISGSGYANGDAFTFDVVQGWTAQRSTYDAGTDTDGELILEGVGLGGGEAIVVGVQSFRDAGNDRYNWRLRGFTSFDGSTWNALPGASTEVYLPLWSSSIPYWLIVNEQRLVLMAKVSTIYVHAYLGFVDTYATDTEHAYPLLVGGSALTDTVGYSDAASLRAYWADSGLGNPGYLYRPDGVWDQVRQDSTTGVELWPWTLDDETWFTHLRDGFGLHPMLPAVLISRPSGTKPRGVVGELDGVYWVSGFGASVEDTVTVGSQDHVLGQDINRNGRNDHVALELA
jgi:hypothetical protein